MRLWSIHPKYLDSKGLVACWREALLAQQVLLGKTKGYRKHPQLIRFKEQKNPVESLGAYLNIIVLEANKRNYSFDASKIHRTKTKNTISVTSGQIQYEFKHLLNKLKARDSKKYKELLKIKKIKPHPLFNVKKGLIEKWEIR